MQKKTWIGIMIAAVLALGVTTAAPPPAAGEGSIPHGYPQSMWPTTADVARVSEWSAYGLATMLQQIYRSGAGTYLDVCTDTGFQCVAGTGFNVDVSPGICMYNDATGATAPIPAFRYVQELAAATVTDWDANPGAATYYVHVYYNDATADGVVSSDPTYVVDTTANPAGAELTVCSIVVGGAEPDATTYAYTDSRTVGNGLHYAPTAVPVVGTTGTYSGLVQAADLTATDDLVVGDDATITGDLVVDTITIGTPAAPAAPSVPGFVSSGWAYGHLDCSVAGTCDILDSPIDMGLTFPANSLVLGCGYTVTAQCASATDAATIALSIGAIGATDVVAPTAIGPGGTAWDLTAPQTFVVGVQALDRSAPINLTGAADGMVATVAIEDLSAGCEVWMACEYLVQP